MTGKMVAIWFLISSFIALGLELSQVQQLTGREAPTVIT